MCGMAFGQELMIHDGVRLKTKRGDSNINVFRCLCEMGSRLCIIESKDKLSFGELKELLLKIGVTEAIYFNGGAGRNHSFIGKMSLILLSFIQKNITIAQIG